MRFFRKKRPKPDPTAYLMPWDEFVAGMEDPDRREATIERTLAEIANGPRYRHLTYDPFTLQSRIFGPTGRIDGR